MCCGGDYFFPKNATHLAPTLLTGTDITYIHTHTHVQCQTRNIETFAPKTTWRAKVDISPIINFIHTHTHTHTHWCTMVCKYVPICDKRMMSYADMPYRHSFYHCYGYRVALASRPARAATSTVLIRGLRGLSGNYNVIIRNYSIFIVEFRAIIM